MKCFNHQDRDAEIICMKCKKGFCRKCVVLINDSYYCKQHGVEAVEEMKYIEDENKQWAGCLINEKHNPQDEALFNERETKQQESYTMQVAENIDKTEKVDESEERKEQEVSERNYFVHPGLQNEKSRKDVLLHFLGEGVVIVILYVFFRQLFGIILSFITAALLTAKIFSDISNYSVDGLMVRRYKLFDDPKREHGEINLSNILNIINNEFLDLNIQSRIDGNCVLVFYDNANYSINVNLKKNDFYVMLDENKYVWWISRLNVLDTYRKYRYAAPLLVKITEGAVRMTYEKKIKDGSIQRQKESYERNNKLNHIAIEVSISIISLLLMVMIEYLPGYFRDYEFEEYVSSSKTEEAMMEDINEAFDNLQEEEEANNKKNESGKTSNIEVPEVDNSTNTNESNDEGSNTSIRYSNYYNDRFGFSIDYPDFFEFSMESGNRDGCIFKDKNDTVEMTAAGINNVFQQSPEELLKEALINFDRIGYQYSDDTYYVVSYVYQGVITYECGYLGKGSINKFSIQYPEENIDEFDAVVTHIYESFVPGDFGFGSLKLGRLY